jgi:MGT family glycosyltransferase
MPNEMEKQLNFLFVTIEGGGNVPPVLGLARRMAARGHRVRVLSEPCMQAPVAASGLEFISFRKHFIRKDRTTDIFKDWRGNPNASFEQVVLGPAQIQADETRDAMKAAPTDVLVADCLLPGSLIAAEAMNVPRVCLFHMPEYLPGPGRPPTGLGLMPGTGFFWQIRDRLLNGVFHHILNKYLPVINLVRDNYGLPRLSQTVDLLHQADIRMIQTSRTFDFPIASGAPNVRYVGPVLDDPDWVEEWHNPWPATDTRPLVVVSFSSTFQNQAATISRCITALSQLDVRALVTLGPAMANERFPKAENVVLTTAVSHAQVFPQADVVVGHAGHGTLMRTLSNGLPMLCLPMGRDQNDNAAKVVYHGAGLQLSPKARPQKIRKAIERLLADPAYRHKAQILREQILTDARAELAVKELESLATAKGKVRA